VRGVRPVARPGPRDVPAGLGSAAAVARP
jgi:hypothetical protein